MRAANSVPSPKTIFSETVVMDTHDARGKWQLHINYPVEGFYSGVRFTARKDFENGSYLALGLLTLLGLGWHRTNIKRTQEMKESSKALQLVNDDITRLNLDLAEKMRLLREAHDEIIKKGKLAQMGQLVATVAHELRNPLSAVRTSAYLLKRKLTGHSVNVDTQLQRIDNSVARCDAVITQFLDYAKSHQLEYKEFPVDNWVVKLVEEEAQKLPEVIEVECNLGLDGVSASFDPNRLSRVLINLISNASEAMVGKGDDPQKFKTQTPKISVVTRQSRRGIEIDVSDNGPGIAEEQIPKILEPLFTTKSFGTGLGLPAAIQVLEQHRGGLQVNGGLGKGATFTAWIPLSPSRFRPPKHQTALLGGGDYAINASRSRGTEAGIVSIGITLGFAPQRIEIILGKAAALFNALHRVAKLAGLAAVEAEIAFCGGNAGPVGGNQIRRGRLGQGRQTCRSKHNGRSEHQADFHGSVPLDINSRVFN